MLLYFLLILFTTTNHPYISAAAPAGHVVEPAKKNNPDKQPKRNKNKNKPQKRKNKQAQQQKAKQKQKVVKQPVAQPSEQPTIVDTTQRPVHLTNTIDKKKLGYSKFVVTYNPTLFEVTSQQTALPIGATVPVVATGNIVDIKYYCEFKDGARKSCYTYRYKIPATLHKADITFEWKREPRLMITGADLLEQQRIEVENP